MVKGNKLYSNFKSIFSKGKGVHEGASQSNGFWTEQAQPQHAASAQCRKENFNFTPVQTCFLGNTVALASEGDNKEKMD
eukprot:2983561-Ditylum_brightwellii.AAC.1